MAELLCDGASCDSHALYLVRDGIWNLLSGGEDWIQQLRTVTDAAGRNWLFANIIYRLAEAGLEPGATLRPQSVAVDAAGRVWFLAWDYPTWNLESSRTRRAGPAYVVCSKLRR